MPISKTIAWRLFWAVKFFKKVFPSLSYGQSKLVPNRGTFAGPEGASIASQCCSPFGPPSLWDGLLIFFTQFCIQNNAWFRLRCLQTKTWRVLIHSKRENMLSEDIFKEMLEESVRNHVHKNTLLYIYSKISVCTLYIIMILLKYINIKYHMILRI